MPRVQFQVSNEQPKTLQAAQELRRVNSKGLSPIQQVHNGLIHANTLFKNKNLV